jgi:cyanocobalamin reductase (cyanide-eliminating) / alkylcobalamin dealkylase
MELGKIAADLTRQGLDLLTPFAVQDYNAVVEKRLHLPTFDRDRTLGLLIGSTRAFWPCFLGELRGDRSLQRSLDPVQDFVAASMARLRQRAECRNELRFAHETSPDRLVALQRLAHLAGLAWLAPCNLSIHPVYGPWIALRAVWILDATGPQGPPPAWVPPCAACPTACSPAFERARAFSSHDLAQWQPWLEVRDACPLGRQYRYSDAQIQYHYGKDRSALLRMSGVETGIA